jgi:hypothetical protein
MRLGQLSRKVSVRSTDIAAFLSAKGILLEDQANAKISDDVARMVIDHFAPHLTVDQNLAEEVTIAEEVAIAEEVTIAEEEEQNMLTSAVAKDDEPQIEVVNTGLRQEDPLPHVGPEAAQNDVIKAPKIELQGLKVVGKIELPQPRKKESEAIPEQGETEGISKTPEKNTRPERGRRHEKTGSSPRRSKNPIALRREREEKDAEEKRKAAQEREKEKRTQYYNQRVKTAAPVRRARLVDEPLAQLEDEAPDEPKTLWGKFVKWLTSY